MVWEEQGEAREAELEKFLPTWSEVVYEECPHRTRQKIWSYKGMGRGSQPVPKLVLEQPLPVSISVSKSPCPGAVALCVPPWYLEWLPATLQRAKTWRCQRNSQTCKLWTNAGATHLYSVSYARCVYWVSSDTLKKMTPDTIHQKPIVLNPAAAYSSVASPGQKVMNKSFLSFLRHLRLNAFSFVLLCVCTMSSDWTGKGLCEVIWGLGNTKLQFLLGRPSKVQQECSLSW